MAKRGRKSSAIRLKFIYSIDFKAMALAQNIKQQEDLILQSAVFKSAKPVNILFRIFFILNISY